MTQPNATEAAIMGQPANFRNFSGHTYSKTGVANACLALQDRHGLDVNMLLFCCWFGRTRGVLDEPLWERVLAFSEPWADNVVRPLRTTRTWMKHTGCAQSDVSNEKRMTLREEIKRVEFKAEQLQEDTMEELARNAPQKIFDSTSQINHSLMNLKNYFIYMKVRLDSVGRADLACVVTGAIRGATLGAVTESIYATFR